MSENDEFENEFPKMRTTARAVLKFIYDYKQSHPYSPDVREIMAQVGMPSTSVVNYHLDRLEEYGLISFLYIPRGSNAVRGAHRGARTVHLTPKGIQYISRTRSREISRK